MNVKEDIRPRISVDLGMGCVQGKKLDDGPEGSVRVHVNNSIPPVCVLRMEIIEDDNDIKNTPDKAHLTNVKKKIVNESKPLDSSPVVVNGGDVKSMKFDANVTAKYRFNNIIGTGRYSRVWVVESRLTKKPYAMKLTSGEEGKYIYNSELNILSRVRHPNIVQLSETFEREDRFYMVLELATGGDLFDRTASQPGGCFTEPDAARITYMIADGLRYLHGLFITHRDLKLDNLLFYHPGPDSKILITDFAVAHIRKPNASKYMETACGTPEYLAPEVLLHRPYTSSVDLWSLGVVVYSILSGSFPFTADENNPGNNNQLYLSIVRGNYSFGCKIWKTVSELGIDFIKKLLNPNPEERLTAADAMRHPWLVRYDSSPNSSLSSSGDVCEDTLSSTANIGRRRNHENSRDPELSKLKQCIIEHRNARF